MHDACLRSYVLFESTLLIMTTDTSTRIFTLQVPGPFTKHIDTRDNSIQGKMLSKPPTAAACPQEPLPVKESASPRTHAEAGDSLATMFEQAQDGIARAKYVAALLLRGLEERMRGPTSTL